MARIYTSRQMIDPSMFSLMNNAMQQRLANKAERDRMVMGGIRDFLTAAGKGFDEYAAQARRENEVSSGNDWNVSPEVANDPVYKAAREEYIRTGSSGPLQQFVMQKQAADTRKEEAQLRAAQEAQDKAWHDAVRLAQARPEYSKVQKAMFDAIDAGDYETADIMKKQLQAYETEFGSDAFGGSAESIAEARKKSAEVAAAKKAEEERLARMGENLEKDFADKSYEQRIWIETNIIPNLKSVADKAEAKTQVERMAANLTDEDRKALHAKIDAAETVGEAKQKAVQAAQASNAGKVTEEQIIKNKASKYIGQKMNFLTFDDIPEEIRKYLKMDSKGIVGWK